MKKVFISVSLCLLLLVLLALVFKQSLLEFVYEKVTTDMFVTQDKDNFSPGSNIGDPFPTINATLNGETITSIKQYAGNKGTIFVVSRSLDWCPYCMKQMAELNNNLSAFQQSGIGLVGLTYDVPAKQAAFKNKFQIAYPILSDNEAASVITLGILNEEYALGDEAYGIGHPGAFIIDTNGIIVGKVFIEAYSLRMDANSLLQYANSVLQE